MPAKNKNGDLINDWKSMNDKNRNGKDSHLDEKLDGWYKQNKKVSTRHGTEVAKDNNKKLYDANNGKYAEIKDVEINDGIDFCDAEWEKRNLRYGWGKWTPDCLQVFNTIRWYVFWTCIFSLFQGFIVNGVINVVITTLEKRFDLPSSRSGLIASSNDFLALFLVLFISFYGSRRHKPRLISIGVVVLGLGSLIFSLPHFFTGLYNYAGSDLEDFENVCRPSNGTEAVECSHEEGTSNLQSYLYVFMIANALHGAGSTPLFTLGTTFIDENSKAEQTPLYLGIIYSISCLGVAAGYMGGGQVLNLYTDADRVTMESIQITPMDPRWVGAWWIPFLVCGTIMILIAIPILGYPKRLPGSAALQLKRKSETVQTKDDNKVTDKNFGKNWRDFPKSLLNLLKNPTFVFLSLSACTEGMIISGIATFGAKFLQEKFNLPAALAGFVMGIITVPGAGGGMLLGGFLVKKRKLKCKGIIRMNMIAAFIGLLFGCVFLLQCPTQSIAGVTTDYVSGSERSDSIIQLNNDCNINCGCSAALYEPVCGMDGAIYFTPCHAGCDDNFELMMGPMGPFKMYTNCSCVAASMVHKSMTMNDTSTSGTTTTSLPLTTVAMDMSVTEEANLTGPPIGAFQGICMSDCQLLYVVAPLLFVGMMMTFLTCSPTQTATLRCVQGNQRALAIGFQWLFLRLLGTTPGPIMLGTIMDYACQVWQFVCGEPGTCWIYAKTSMGLSLFFWWCIVKLLCLLFYFLAQYFYKPIKDDRIKSDDDNIYNKDTSNLTDPMKAENRLYEIN